MHRIHVLRPVVLLALALLLGRTTSAQPAPPPDLDRYVAAVQETFEVPGLALAIVYDGRVVVAKGYGVRDENEAAPVTEETLFGIASNSKAFTGTALGILVEEGKLDWDDRVVDHLPWFQLSDPYVTRELTVRDLLVHRSGLSLGAGDLLWWPASTYSSEELVRRLRHVPLTTSFRNAYAYDNVLYVVAGELVRAVTGQSWEDFVAERILEPAGMDGTRVGPTAALADDNVALPHARILGEVRRVEPYRGENANAAAGLYAGAEDMARWMTVQLDSGRVAPDARIFEPPTAKALWSLVTPIPIGTYPPELAVLQPEFYGYGLGFFVRDYRGHKMITHTGGLPGYLSQVAMIPALKLGVAVLTNQESGAAFNALTYHVLDHYLGAAGEVDWLRIFRERAEQGEARLTEVERRIAAARDTTTRPSLPLADYAGTYTDPWYGDVVITEADGGLAIRFAHTPWLDGELEHWQHDTFLARWDPEVRADAFVTFALEPDGSVEQARIVPASPRVDFSFDFQDLVLTPAGE